MHRISWYYLLLTESWHEEQKVVFDIFRLTNWNQEIPVFRQAVWDSYGMSEIKKAWSISIYESTHLFAFKILIWYHLGTPDYRTFMFCLHQMIPRKDTVLCVTISIIIFCLCQLYTKDQKRSMLWHTYRWFRPNALEILQSCTKNHPCGTTESSALM